MFVYDVGKGDSIKCCLEAVCCPVLYFMSNEELRHMHGSKEASEMMPPSMSFPLTRHALFGKTQEDVDFG